MIKRGDTVKLTARAAAAFKQAPTGRRGVVERSITNKANAVVLGDGRLSREYVLISAIDPKKRERAIARDHARRPFSRRLTR